jgi:hypothetical protein
MLKYASKYLKIPAQVMKIVIFHFGWLKKAEIPNGPCRKSIKNWLKIQGVWPWKESKGLARNLFRIPTYIQRTEDGMLISAFWCNWPHWSDYKSCSANRWQWTMPLKRHHNSSSRWAKISQNLQNSEQILQFNTPGKLDELQLLKYNSW